MNNYTLLKLSKLLADNGFERESECIYVSYSEAEEIIFVNTNYQEIGDGDVIANAYDILNDLCVRYSKEMFGENKNRGSFQKWESASTTIFLLVRQNKKQEAEEYIWKHCLFNPKNK